MHPAADAAADTRRGQLMKKLVSHLFLTAPEAARPARRGPAHAVRGARARRDPGDQGRGVLEDPHGMATSAGRAR